LFGLDIDGILRRGIDMERERVKAERAGRGRVVVGLTEEKRGMVVNLTEERGAVVDLTQELGGVVVDLTEEKEVARVEIPTKTPRKRKMLAPLSPTPKRRRLSEKKHKENNSYPTPPSTLAEKPLLDLTDDLTALLLSATVISTTQSNLDEITALMPHTRYLHIPTSDDDKENTMRPPCAASEDVVVLVDQYRTTTVQRVLKMAKEASIIGGRWYVYNWKVVRCLSSDTKTEGRNEHLWTYRRGEAL